MADNEPASEQPEAATAQAAPGLMDASVAVIEEAVDTPTPKGEDASASGENTTKDSEKNEKGEGKGEEVKPKRTTPYLNKHRVKTGGTPKQKLTPEELAERMERIRLNNEKIKERRATVEADQQAFEASQVAARAAQRAKEASTRRIQAGIDANRNANAKRKMDKLSGREWDSFKGANGAGTNASMHAPQSSRVSTDADASGARESSPGQEQAPASPAGGESEGGRGRGRGRGAGRARGGGRGARGGRGRGGAGGGNGGGGGGRNNARERAPHMKEKDTKEEGEKDDGGWGEAAENWGQTTTIDWGSSEDAPGTGIAITTNDDDPWGIANSTAPVAE